MDAKIVLLKRITFTCMHVSAGLRCLENSKNLKILTHLSPIKGTLANNIDPDKTPRNAASDQGL